MRVVTYQSSQYGSQKRICPACERELRRAGTWPHDTCGEQLHSVYKGLHGGACDVHTEEQRGRSNIF